MTKKDITPTPAPNELFWKYGIRPEEIAADCIGDNYKTQLNVHTELNDGEYVEVTVTSPSPYGLSASTQKFITIATSTSSYSKFIFDVITPGIHKILIQKKDSNGSLIAEKIIYKAFSYSKEYTVFKDEEKASKLLSDITKSGNGKNIQAPEDVFIFNSENQTD